MLEVYDNIAWESDDDKHKPRKVLEALENYCNPRDNEVLESHRFWNIQYQEPFDKFLCAELMNSLLSKLKSIETTQTPPIHRQK